MIWHVLPQNDTREHEERSTCDCRPRVEYSGGDMIVVHNAFDGREIGEALVGKLLEATKIPVSRGCLVTPGDHSYYRNGAGLWVCEYCGKTNDSM